MDTIPLLPVSDADLTVETILGADAFEGLQSEWESLLAECDADNLFLTWQWQFSWWRHLGGDSALQILALRHGARLVALAPFALRPGSVQRLPPVSALQFLGSGVAGSDYLDLIVRRGYEGAAVRVLAQRLDESGRTLALTRMRPVGPAAGLVEHMLEHGWRSWQGPSEVCPYVSLRGLSFESYLSSLGAEHRYAFRRKLTRLERSGSARFELAHSDAERHHALNTLFALHARRWETRGEAGAFASHELRAFHDEVTRRARAAGWLRLWTLHIAGEPAAALYGFLYERKFYFYQSGFDPRFARDSAGMVLLGIAIREAIEDGCDELDLLHGTERYKAHWTHATRELVRFELHAPGTRGFLEREATALTRRARRVGRVLLDTGRRAIEGRAPGEHAASR